MIVVTDAGPLIYLGGAGQLDLLRSLFDEVVVPRIVFEEVTFAGRGKAGSAELEAAHWIRVVEAQPEPPLLARLDRGEAAAIPLALALGAVLLVDDREARAVASERGLTVVGTLGVLLAAKQRGLLASVAVVLDQMVGLGMFVSPALRREALRRAGEAE